LPSRFDPNQSTQREIVVKGQPWEETMDAPNTKEKLTNDLLKFCLLGTGLKEEDDHFSGCPFADDSFILRVKLQSPTTISMACWCDKLIPPGKYPPAIMCCNSFHRKIPYGHAHLYDIDNNRTVPVYEVWWDFEDGAASFIFAN
jgi:hypothetical protein